MLRRVITRRAWVQPRRPLPRLGNPLVYTTHRFKGSHNLSDVERRAKKLTAEEEQEKKSEERATGSKHEAYKDTADNPFTFEPRLERARTAIPFPPMELTNIKGEARNMFEAMQGKISLVGVYHNRMNEEQMSKWINAFKYESHDIQIVQVGYVPGWTFRLLKRLMTNEAKKTVPVERHDTFFLHYDTFTDVEEEVLEYESKYWLHIYLVDHRGRIRGRSAGSPQPRDLQLLDRFMTELEMERAAGRGRHDWTPPQV